MSRKIKLLLLALVMLAGSLIYAESETGIITGLIDKSRRVMLPDSVIIEYSADSKPVFAKGTNGFLCVTKDGAAFYSYKGKLLWSETFTMNEPYIIKEGRIFAVLDPLGRKAYVCDSSGVLYTVTPEYPILSAGVNKLGYLMLILRGDDGVYRIPLYKNSTDIPLVGMSEIDGIFPISADVSDDGYMFSVAYIDTTKNNIVSRVLYSYTEEGSEKLARSADKPFKAIERNAGIVLKLQYLSNGNLMVLTDDEVFITTKEGEEIQSIKTQNRIASISFSDDMFGYVSGEPNPNAETPLDKGFVQWFTQDGELGSSFDSDQIEKITMDNDLILLKSEHNYYCVDKSGRVLWKIGAGQDIIDVVAIDDKRAIIAKASYAEIYRLKPPRNE